MSEKTFTEPDDDIFCLWRAVLGLVHADDDFSQEEQDYVDNIITIFSFSRKQRKIIHKDLKSKPDIVDLFKDLQDEDLIHQFFIIARTIIWCDGFLHNKERDMIKKIVESLGEDAQIYQNELRWMERKPIMLDSEAGEAPVDDVMQMVVQQMRAFYEEKSL